MTRTFTTAMTRPRPRQYVYLFKIEETCFRIELELRVDVSVSRNDFSNRMTRTFTTAMTRSWDTVTATSGHGRIFAGTSGVTEVDWAAGAMYRVSCYDIFHGLFWWLCNEKICGIWSIDKHVYRVLTDLIYIIFFLNVNSIIYLML